MPQYGSALSPDDIVNPQAHVCNQQYDADFRYVILKIEKSVDTVRYNYKAFSDKKELNNLERNQR
jgi:hypothetical protein